MTNEEMETRKAELELKLREIASKQDDLYELEHQYQTELEELNQAMRA